MKLLVSRSSMFFLRNREHKSAAAIIKMEWRSEQIRVHSTAKSMGFRRYFPPSPLQRSLDDLWLRFGLKWPPSPTELCGPRRKKSLNEPAGIGGDWHTENRICTLLLFSCVEISDPILSMSLFKSERNGGPAQRTKKLEQSE